MKIKTSRLGELTSVITKGTTPTSVGFDFAESGIPFLRVQNIVDGAVDLTKTPLFISEVTHKALARSSICPGDLLISIAGTIGRAAVVSDDAVVMNSNQAVGIVRLKEGLSSRFLLHWLQSNDALGQIKGAQVTGTITNLSLTELRNLKIPLPPLAEQKRIAGILDAADALRAKRRESLAQLDALLQSTFLTLFGDPVENPMGWDDSSLLGTLTDIVSGVAKGRKLGGKSVREVPYLAVANVQDKHLKLDVVKSINATEDEIAKYRLLNNDLLLTEGGDPDKLGRGSLWHEDIPECIHQNHIFRVRITSGEIDPIFLNWIIGSPRGKNYFLRSAKQTTGIASINMTQLRAFPMLLPPLPLQQRFAAVVESVERQKSAQRAHLAELDALFAALQHRAFRGEL